MHIGMHCAAQAELNHSTRDKSQSEQSESGGSSSSSNSGSTRDDVHHAAQAELKPLDWSSLMRAKVSRAEARATSKAGGGVRREWGIGVVASSGAVRPASNGSSKSERDSSSGDSNSTHVSVHCASSSTTQQEVRAKVSRARATAVARAATATAAHVTACPVQAELNHSI